MILRVQRVHELLNDVTNYMRGRVITLPLFLLVLSIIHTKYYREFIIGDIKCGNVDVN